ncbi:MAG: OsmC family protein [Gammaproteobacteria bacterium]|nr:OsmC family protein [Gammaproteobacteria bacterium]
MASYKVKTVWSRTSLDFTLKSFNRGHHWEFEGGSTVAASAPTQYGGEADKVNPEQAFVASLSSCHMLTFLAIASGQGFVIDSYQDDAVGELGKLDNGRQGMISVTLTPTIEFTGERKPDAAELSKLHEMAHKNCFIANSVTTKIKINH